MFVNKQIIIIALELLSGCPLKDDEMAPYSTGDRFVCNVIRRMNVFHIYVIENKRTDFYSLVLHTYICAYIHNQV